jgi:hypothetical protein
LLPRQLASQDTKQRAVYLKFWIARFRRLSAQVQKNRPKDV